jgi:hypothetical protein
VSFGLRSGPAFTINIRTGIQQGPGWTGLLSNSRYRMIFTVIYETVP